MMNTRRDFLTTVLVGVGGVFVPKWGPWYRQGFGLWQREVTAVPSAPAFVTGVVRITVAEAFPQSADRVTLTYRAFGVANVTPASGQPMALAAHLTEAPAGYIDLTVDRPAFGSTGRVVFIATTASRSGTG